MDDHDLEKIASNNPAMTVPASSGLSRYNDQTQTSTRGGNQAHARNKPHSRPSDISSSSSTTGATAPQTHATTATTKTSDPSGESTTIPLKPTLTTNSHEPSKYDRGWRRVVRNFSPSWFSTTMGTGIVSLLLITIPFKAAWLYWLSVLFFALNAALFAAAFVVSLLRYTLYPQIWTVMIRDPTNSLFLGTIPMGFATLIESWVFLCCPYWGDWSVYVAWALWMVDAVASFGVTVSLMFLLISESHQQQLDRITAAQLLPIAATIVSAGAGVEVAELLNRVDGAQGHALGTLVTGYVMWGMATPFAMTVLVMYYQRLALHKLPSREIIVSSFLPLGPLGMGGYTIFYAGKVAREILPRVSLLSHISIAGDVLYMMGLLLALLMWGFGLVWLCFALATIWSCGSFPFNMGWWGFTFPLGVFAISTITFGTELPSLFFSVLGTIFAVAVILLWCVVAAGTARGAWSGKLFYAPCLKNLQKVEEERGPNAGVDVDIEKADRRK